MYYIWFDSLGIYHYRIPGFKIWKTRAVFYRVNKVYIYLWKNMVDSIDKIEDDGNL